MTKLGASSPNAVKSSSAYVSYDKTTAFAFLYLGCLSVVFHMHYIHMMSFYDISGNFLVKYS